MTTNITIPRALLEQLVGALKQIQAMTDGRDFYIGSPPKESKERKILNLATEALTAGRAALEGAQRVESDCRIELVAAIHGLASDFENVLGIFDRDSETRKKAQGDIAHAMKIAGKWNWNGTAPVAPKESK